MLLFLLSLLWGCATTPARAGCVTLDTTGWPQEKSNMRVALAYEIAGPSSGYEVPTVTGSDICFAVFDPTGTMTASAMDRAYQARRADNAATASALAAAKTANASEITGNNLCTATLQQITERIDSEHAAIQAEIDAAATLITAKQAMTVMNQKVAAALKKVARCLNAKTD